MKKQKEVKKVPYSEEWYKFLMLAETKGYREELALLRKNGIKKNSWLFNLAEELHDLTVRGIKLNHAVWVQETKKSKMKVRVEFLKEAGKEQVKLLNQQLKAMSDYQSILLRRLALAYKKYLKADKKK
jgi:hypothetical protein